MKKVSSFFKLQKFVEQCNAFFIKKILTGIFVLCSFMSLFGQTPCPPQSGGLTLNPAFPGCQRATGTNDAFKVVLVLDESGSIGNARAEDEVETAVRGFASSLEGGATANGQLELAIVEFSSSARIAFNFTDVFNNGTGISTLVNNYLNNNYFPLGGTNFTNPLVLVRDQLSAADMVFFITDGEPEDSQSSYRSIANQIKCKGAYLFCIGVNIENNSRAIQNLQQISGDVFFPATRLQDGANIALESFVGLAECLSVLADDLVDDTPPTLTGCVDMQTIANSTDCGAMINFTPQAEDDCGIASLVCVPASGSFFPVGLTTVTCTATDNAGLTSTCTFTVTVSDTTAPVVITRNIEVPLGINRQVTITPQQIDNGSEDACGIADLSLDITLFDFSQLGENTVTLTVTDNSGNTAFGTAQVTVVDTVVSPPLSCPSNCSGDNTFLGVNAGLKNTTGKGNAFFGLNAGMNNTTGSFNSFFGTNAGSSNTEGSGNVFLGRQAGFNEQGSNKLYIANSSTNSPLIYGEFNNELLRINGRLEVRDGISLDGFEAKGNNLFAGLLAGEKNISGESNVFLGEGTGFNNTTGNFNTFVGRSAGRVNTKGSSNTYVGWDAGLFHIDGNHNTFIGARAGFSDVLAHGERNTYLGAGAGATSGNSGSGNVFIGYNVGRDQTVSNKLFIDNENVSNPLLYGDFQKNVVTVNGSLGIGIQDPERPIHLRATNAIFRIDRDRDDPGFAIVRYDNGFNNVWKSFYFYTRSSGPNNGKFVIADWGINVSGPSTPRFVISNNGNVGIGARFENLNNDATAKLHVDGSVRFQNLPTGTGQVLVIDNNGNVGVSNSLSRSGETSELTVKVEAQAQEIQALKEELAVIKASLNINSASSLLSNQAQLYQNQPNPFSQETTIRFSLPDAVQSATLYIYDMQGNPIKEIALNQRGESEVKLHAGVLKVGMYLYSLVADGQEVAMKRMIITR